jgi:valyl-tRNA synthetase
VISFLAGISDLTIDPDAKREPGSASKVVGDLRILIHDVIDESAERERLEKALAKVAREIGICEKKLANPKFVHRAPAEVVQEQRHRMAEYQAEQKALESSLDALLEG